MIVPHKGTQLDLECATRILRLEHELISKDRIIRKYQSEDSEAGAITEICTEASSSSSEVDSVEKSRLKEWVKLASRRLRKQRAKVVNDRLKAAFDAGLLLGQKDSTSSDKSGVKILLQGKLERRCCIRHLGRAFKRGLATAIRSGEKNPSDSTSVTREQSRY
mgnify:CR=1 FL=1